MNVCLFGGTFDPPHNGHEMIMNELLKKDFDKIIIMPTGEVDYKRVQTDKLKRLEMVKIWANFFLNEKIEVSDYEVNLNKMTKTHETIKYLKEKYNYDKITLAIGNDSYIDLDSWDNVSYIKENAEILVFNRDEEITKEGEVIPISSTELRTNFEIDKVNQIILPYIVLNQVYNLQPYIMKRMEVSEEINCEEEIKKRIIFLKQQLLLSNQKKMILAISGGQDSTLMAKICQLTIEKMGPDYELELVRLPYKVQFDEHDCIDVINWLQSEKVSSYNIGEIVDILKEMFPEATDFNIGNAKARVRMLIQYIISGSGGLVVGTDHSAESVAGFYTKYGDGGVDVNPLFGLNKRQGKKLLKFLGCPKHLYEKDPTADLEDEKVGVPDEVSLGVDYDTLDDYLEGKTIGKKEKIIIENLYIKSEHKRNKIPTLKKS